jgi:hypothetical protein
MANEQNLRPFTSDQDREEAKKNGIKGGKASGLARRQKRTMREIAEAIGNMELKNARLLAMMHDAGFEGTPTMDDAAFFGVCVRAQKGDPQALKLLAEMRGQYSTRVEVEPVQPKPLIDLTEDKK